VLRVERPDYTSLFRTVDESAVHRYGPGEVVFSAGDPGSALYVVRAGEIVLSKDGRELERVEAGGMFGELALVDGEPRNATATAVGAAELVAVDEDTFQRLVRHNPFFALTVLRLVAKRLRQVTNPSS
jgi:CRP/FNR family transcriptional regulator, cyclic AMP receptor protein